MVLCGCAPYILRSQYFYLLPQAQLEVVRKEKKFIRESRPLLVATPTIWRLNRQDYVVEFALGDRWYPQIMAEAMDSAGRKLQIVSPQFRESAIGEQKRPISLRGQVYRYFARAEECTENYLELEIRDSMGRRLGVEKIPFEMRQAKSLRVETI